MEQIIQQIRDLWSRYSNGREAASIVKLPQSGSDRMYFRVTGANGETCIATYNDHLKENETFFAFSTGLRSVGCPVANVLTVNENGNIYLQEDFGDISLLNLLEAHGYNDYVYSLFRQSLAKLAHLQVVGGTQIDYSHCLTAREFGKQAILSDLLYFKYYFLDTLKFPYDKQALLDDFEALSTMIFRL